MSSFVSIQPGELPNAMDMVNDWFLLTAAKPDGSVNTMTCGWGGFGIFWRKKGCVVMVRESRYTYEFTEQSDVMSLCFFDGGNRKELGYLGKVSGRDEDKIAKSGLALLYDGGIPYFEQAKTVIFAKKLYSQLMDPACFHDKNIDADCYPTKDYHRFYFCEILKVLKNS